MPMNSRLLRPLARGRYNALRVGLVAYWPLNEDASSGDVTAEDWTGRGNNLTSNNTVPSVTGRTGNGRHLTAANTEFLAASTDRTDLRFMDGRSWTFAFWFYMPGAWPATSGAFVCRDGVSSGQRETLCSTNLIGGTQRRITWETGPGTSPNIAAFVQDSATTGDRIPLDAWHFVAFTFDWSSRVLSGRLNAGTRTGETGTGTLAAGTPVVGTRPLNLGRRPSGTPDLFLTGYMDEVAKWDRVLSSAELDTLYNSGNGIDLRT
jgi:hypothetical protein